MADTDYAKLAEATLERAYAERDRVHEAFRIIADALAAGDKPECEHEWVDARNEAVLSGEWCPKCNAIRAAGDKPNA